MARICALNADGAERGEKLHVYVMYVTSNVYLHQAKRSAETIKAFGVHERSALIFLDHLYHVH